MPWTHTFYDILSDFPMTFGILQVINTERSQRVFWKVPDLSSCSNALVSFLHVSGNGETGCNGMNENGYSKNCQTLSMENNATLMVIKCNTHVFAQYTLSRTKAFV